MRAKVSAIVVALLVSVALAVQGTDVVSAAPRSGGIPRFGQSAADLGTLDPHFATGTQDRSLVDMLFNARIRYKPGNGSGFEPDLATTLPKPATEGGKQAWIFSASRSTGSLPAGRATPRDCSG